MKFHGAIGFWVDDAEIRPGQYAPKIVERPGYHGDVLRSTLRTQAVSNQQNDNLTVSNQLSILSDLYLQQNWASVRYVVWGGKRWTVTNVDVGYPRITLDVGGVYNGPIVGGTEDSPDEPLGDS